jgi:hypothetical protein
MKFPRNPLIKFAERRKADLSVSKIPASTESSTLFLKTKYGLRLQVSDDTTRIESIRHHGKRLYEEFAGDDDKPPTLNAVTPRHDPRSIFTPLSYRLFPDWHTSYLWYKDWTFDNIHVDEDVIKDRLPGQILFRMA